MIQYEVRSFEASLYDDRLALILSPDDMNSALDTVIVAPLTRSSHGYPTRPWLRIRGEDWWIALDQVGTVEKSRLSKKLAMLGETEVRRVKSILLEMLVR